jgi:hypothetical protein
MKRCPLCGKMYGYELLRFCRFDGSRLLDITSSEAPTIRFNADEVPCKTGELRVESVTGEHKVHPFQLVGK